MRGHACLLALETLPARAGFRLCAELASAILMRLLDPTTKPKVLGAAYDKMTKKPLTKYHPTMPGKTQMASRLA